MFSSNKIAYFDESGNPDKCDSNSPGASRNFIISTVIVERANLIKFNKMANDIKNKYFGSGEIKGSRLGNDTKRRHAILSEVGKLPFKYYALSVNKRDLMNEFDGMNRGDIYKYCLITTMKRLYRIVGYFQAEIDEFGNDEFRKSIITDPFFNDTKTIFNEITLNFKPSIGTLGIQISDIISNSIFSCIEKNNPLFTLSPIKGRELLIQLWPPKPQKFNEYKRLPAASRLDEVVSKFGLNLAYDYIKENMHDDDPDIIARVETIKLLRANALNINYDSHIKAAEIIKIKELAQFDVKDERAFMAKIIAPLRDGGIIIASSNNGYKLPTSVNDIVEFVKTVNGKSLPYLGRLQMTRKELMAATDGNYDPVDPTEFECLAKIMHFMDSASILLH
jgi:hypothetical protein